MDQPVVSRIPPEVLEHIFLDCYHDHSVVPSITDAPFNISQTCSRWREVAVCVPRLWSSFAIIFSSGHSRPSLPVLQRWLYRSGFYPISFSLIYHEPVAYSVEIFASDLNRDLFKVLRTLVGHVDRWKSVYLDLSNIPYDAEFPSHLDHALSQAPSLPNLKDLEIRTFQVHPRHNNCSLIPSYLTWLSGLASSASSLESYSRYGDGYRNHLLSVPTGNLTTLYLERETEFGCLQSLKNSPCLVECHFSEILSDHEWNLPFSAVRTPKLRKLVLEPQEALFETLFPSLVAANLEHLEILVDLQSTRYQTQYMNPLLGLRSFLRESSCPLTTLILRPLLLSKSTLEDCLTVVSSTLTTFITSGFEKAHAKRTRQATWQPLNSTFCIGDSILERLTYTGEPGIVLCPHLETVVFHSCVNASEGKLGDFVESRWRADPEIGHAAQIKKVDVELFKSSSHADVEKLEGIFAEGLQGSVRMAPGIRLAIKEDGVVDRPPSNVPVLQRPSNW
ncbi:hypothetical protein K435DRAFT_870095 [Dendrothele bispora CBS 962.96]|uniref:Uncharacterized protein n=1 Tax=Dendrothele bispora (strain CBS 962.96) TaxID=1314807 RepID=A0A4S8L7H5_DENBC|nr:hypothetical protein K435DRAFT_870095 [Dendrothele bispora CBS 962.96]